MKIKEELRTFTDEAHRLGVKMMTVVDNMNLELIKPEEAAKQIDQMAREMTGIQDTLKDLAYRLARGQERDSTIGVIGVRS